MCGCWPRRIVSLIKDDDESAIRKHIVGGNVEESQLGGVREDIGFCQRYGSAADWRECFCRRGSGRCTNGSDNRRGPTVLWRCPDVHRQSRFVCDDDQYG